MKKFFALAIIGLSLTACAHNLEQTAGPPSSPSKWTLSGTTLSPNNSAWSVAIGGADPLSVDVDGDGDADFILADSAPAAADSAGTAGMVFFAADYVYFCTTTGADGAAAWVRAALSTWP